MNSKGDSGDVEQSNTTAAVAASINENKTEQDIDQESGDGHGSVAIQAAGQLAESRQGAKSDADAKQYGASNSNTPTRVNSKGDDGSVSQSNVAAALSAAVNVNDTDQDIDQKQGCGCEKGRDSKGHGSDAVGIQAAGQAAYSDQWADADADAKQYGARNENTPTDVLSRGDRGSVRQTNAVLSLGIAGNSNRTEQDIDQTHGCGCGFWGDVMDVAGQLSESSQHSDADANSAQLGNRLHYDRKKERPASHKGERGGRR